jgi:hypothetical protein
MFGPSFKTLYTLCDSGQQQFTGLNKQGAAKYKGYVEDSKKARATGAKKRLEKDFLAKLKEANHITEETPEAQAAANKAKANTNKAVAYEEEDDDNFDYQFDME